MHCILLQRLGKYNILNFSFVLPLLSFPFFILPTVPVPKSLKNELSLKWQIIWSFIQPIGPISFKVKKNANVYLIQLQAMEKTMLMLLIVLFPRGCFLVISSKLHGHLIKYNSTPGTKISIRPWPLCLKKKSWGRVMRLWIGTSTFKTFILLYNLWRLEMQKVAKTVRVHVKIWLFLSQSQGELLWLLIKDLFPDFSITFLCHQ